MSSIIGTPFGYIMYWCYELFDNYGIALILFTLFTKIILLPLAVKQQKNQAHMAMFSPKLEKLKKKCGNDKQKFQQEQMKLYNEEGINPMASCLPTLIQLPIIWGLYYVIYAPLSYILRFKSATIDKAIDIINANENGVFDKIVDNSHFKSRPQIYLIDAVKDNPDQFKDLGADFVSKVQDFNYSFFGVNLGNNPNIHDFNVLLLIPIFAFLSQLAYSIFTQHMNAKNNPAANQMGNMKMIMYMFPLLSAVLAFTFPAGIGVYWILNSLFLLLQAAILYRIYTPEKVAAIMKKKQKKRKDKPSLYQRAMEAQLEQQNGGKPVSLSSNDDDDEIKLSKSAMKDLQRKKLAEARKRMAEKYGDTYDEGLE